MNLKLIDNAIKSYENLLDEGDKARLTFFRGIWGIQAEAAKEVADGAYDCPDAAHLEACMRADLTFLADRPCKIDGELLAKHAQQLGDYLLQEGSLSEDACSALKEMNWVELLEGCDLEMAGKKPFMFLDAVGAGLVERGNSELAVSIVLMPLSWALHVQLEKVAIATRATLGKKGFEGVHPRTCPVCGCEASLAHVGGETSSSGRGKLLECAQCGMTWEYDRVRCARCGSTNQAKLHFYNIEGDDAHRIATCDECGGYIRTVYSEDSLRPISYEVEDVVMAKLDAVAATFKNE